MNNQLIACLVISISSTLLPSALSAQPTKKSHPALSYGSKDSLKKAIIDLMDTHGNSYPKGASYLARLAKIENNQQLESLRKEALMANPAIDFDDILIVQRSGKKRWLPANWQCNSSLPKLGHKNKIAKLSLKDQSITPIYQPEGERFIGDLDLHFEGGKILFSSIGEHNAWAVFELPLDRQASPRQITPAIADIDCMDPCYLPNGRIIYASTSGFQGVPCVSGNDYVANLHLLDPKTNDIRRICFDQENNWCPTVLPNGKVMFLRWEYTDSAHYFSRILMQMNPDGTNQKEYYGSNSYWPNSLFYARPVPGSSNQFVGIVTGHHGIARAGELILFDNNKGRHEADGVIQRIPGAGKEVKPIIKDRLVDRSFPLFLHPYPLSNKHFIVSMSLDKTHYGLYLVDTFDNIVPLKIVEGGSIVEAIPMRKTTPPPVKPDLVNLNKKHATFYIQDIYAGPGLKGVPRGTVKSLKVYSYEYAPRNQGGHYAIGMEGPWDVRTVLGTVPINSDGSVVFKAPANIPIAFAPLDAEGKSLQMMRSWTTAMPGEVVSCVGCHEPQSMSPRGRPTMASQMKAKELTPWLGEAARGFSFHREIQPILDESCVGCHTSSLAKKDGRPDFEDLKKSYHQLHPYVRRNGPEGDYHLLTPLEFHADTSELVQLLQKGHYNVELNAEAKEKLITWIDMNVPQHGSWSEAPKQKKSKTEHYLARRAEARKMYANLEIQPETIKNPYTQRKEFIAPRKDQTSKSPIAQIDNWPISKDKALAMQKGKDPKIVDLGNGVKIKLVYIPAGQFINTNGEIKKVDKAFWMSETEITLAQYRQFEASHNNGVYDMHYKDQVDRGYYMNQQEFPVIRTNWNESLAFCEWLSNQSKEAFKLPSAKQWEWASRAGSASAMNYGDIKSNYAKHANLADINLKKMAVRGVDPKPIKNPSPMLDFIPKNTEVNDGVLHLAKVASYQPNHWGLYDMHGNVAEWTSSDYTINNGKGGTDKKTILGGSWRDRSHRAAHGFTLGFPRWQKVYNVGFRVIVEE